MFILLHIGIIADNALCNFNANDTDFKRTGY